MQQAHSVNCAFPNSFDVLISSKLLKIRTFQAFESSKILIFRNSAFLIQTPPAAATGRPLVILQ